MTIIVEAESDDPNELAYDCARAAIIKEKVLEWLASRDLKTDRQNREALGYDASPTVSLHEIEQIQGDFYAAYFVCKKPPEKLFMCTLKVTDRSAALTDIRWWLAKTSGVTLLRLGPVRLDLLHAPKLSGE